MRIPTTTTILGPPPLAERSREVERTPIDVSGYSFLSASSNSVIQITQPNKANSVMNLIYTFLGSVSSFTSELQELSKYSPPYSTLGYVSMGSIENIIVGTFVFACRMS